MTQQEAYEEFKRRTNGKEPFELSPVLAAALWVCPSSIYPNPDWVGLIKWDDYCNELVEVA